MKESVAGVSLFTIVIIFVILFAGYVCYQINYSRAYNLKNEVVDTIKSYSGVCTEHGSDCVAFSNALKRLFKEVNYKSRGKCGEGYVGYSREGVKLGEEARNAAICVKGIPVRTNTELPNAYYYDVRVFYNLDLPIIGSFFEFAVRGETPRIYNVTECNSKKLPSTCESSIPWCSC